ncbi:hypothetical protein [Pengzhenrongella sp.]|uniref:hypothetical protein n=1 Tax=Pengzhenrongella sp. TaxID=2888820 RepID=UPI002F95856D
MTVAAIRARAAGSMMDASSSESISRIGTERAARGSSLWNTSSDTLFGCANGEAPSRKPPSSAGKADGSSPREM